MENIVSDTIAAQATPPGRGGIAIVRVSGPLVFTVMQSMLGQHLKPREATYLPFYDENSDTLDQGVAIYFKAPHSFTGEDVLELQGHGGPVVVDLILKRLLALGVRLARPGEFSERAFLNGKLDLTQAEAIADLIDASSQQAARLALRSLQGEFSKIIHDLSEKLIRLRIYVEAAIDFTDEEIDFLSDGKVREELTHILAVLQDTKQQARQGSLLREGITAVIAGEPNVGKSSLLNALSGKELAIVTPIPGTTRDVLRDHIMMDGMPIHVVDTAGLRDSDDVVEQEGIRRAHTEIEKADVILYVIEASKSLAEVKAALPATAKQRPIIFVRNKIDLVSEPPSMKEDVIALSAKTLAGIDLLKKAIQSHVGFSYQTEGVFLARRRHLDALARAETHILDGFQQLNISTTAPELAAEDLRLAQLALNEITGEFTADDLLGRIFSSFCIGK